MVREGLKYTNNSFNWQPLSSLQVDLSAAGCKSVWSSSSTFVLIVCFSALLMSGDFLRKICILLCLLNLNFLLASFSTFFLFVYYNCVMQSFFYICCTMYVLLLFYVAKNSETLILQKMFLFCRKKSTP